DPRLRPEVEISVQAVDPVGQHVVGADQVAVVAAVDKPALVVAEFARTHVRSLPDVTSLINVGRPESADAAGKLGVDEDLGNGGKAGVSGRPKIRHAFFARS